MTELIRHSEKLFYFFQVAGTGSLQSAARKIGISAPTLSYTIKELEKVLKVSLFERSHRGMKLSLEGQKLKIFCERYFPEMENLTNELVSKEIKFKKKLKIGIFPSIAIYFWPLVLTNFGEDSEYSISLQTNRSRQLLECLIHREIDIAVTVDSVQFDRMIKHELYQDYFSCYTSSRSNKKSVQTKEEIIMMMPDACDEDGKTLKQYVDSQDNQFKEKFELDSFEVISEFTQQGYGIGILPTRVARKNQSRLKKIKALKGVPTDFGLHRFYLTHRDDLDLPQRLIEKLLLSAKKAVKQMNESESPIILKNI